MATVISAGKLVDLLSSATRSNYVRVLGATRLGIGSDPLQPTHVIDLSTETIFPISVKASAPEVFAEPMLDESLKVTRRTGVYWVEIAGRRTDCVSLRHLLAEGLKAIEVERPGTLDKLTDVKPRNRRIVARDPKDLFDKPHLAKEYAQPLVGPWWYGTNNSAFETNVWLKRAAECAKLEWGSTVRTNLDELALEKILA